jgi:hypothetical protein
MPSDSGFVVLPGVLENATLTPIAEALVALAGVQSRAGIRGLLRVPAVRQLASDERLLHIAQEFVGAGPVPFRATLFDKSPIANWLVAWHQDLVLPVTSRVDSREWGPWTIKAGVLHARAPASALATVVALRIHLDDSTSANGPLRVLPHTHDRGVLSRGQIEQLSREIAPVECTERAGGVVVMRPLLLHASSKSEGATPRRVLHIEYASRLRFEDDIELAVV